MPSFLYYCDYFASTVRVTKCHKRHDLAIFLVISEGAGVVCIFFWAFLYFP